MEVWQTSNLQQLRLGEEKRKKEQKKKLQGKNIMACPIPQGAINIVHGVHIECTYKMILKIQIKLLSTQVIY